ncbi:hypothetical protein HMPREF0262_02466 [Clostridium sp. ATCC 29733]|nr:hypothetical protein HMPREF0262_02466 [Clostridium sp. ATCC 29733]
MPCLLSLVLGAFLYGFPFERAGLICQDLTKPNTVYLSFPHSIQPP